MPKDSFESISKFQIMNTLTNNQEKLIKSLYTRHGRKKHNMCICEGIRSCGELIDVAPELVHLILKSDEATLPEKFNNLGFIRVPEKKLKQISATIASQGILMVANKPDLNLATKPADPFIVVLDGVADPGNMGTIIRTVKAIGLKELWLTSGSTDPFAEKVIRAAMAGQFHLSIRHFDNLELAACELRKFGYENIYRTDCHEGRSIFEEDQLFANSAIIFGGEAGGASPLSGSIPITIPMPGKSESINVAQAATVTLFDAVRREIL